MSKAAVWLNRRGLGFRLGRFEFSLYIYAPALFRKR